MRQGKNFCLHFIVCCLLLQDLMCTPCVDVVSALPPRTLGSCFSLISFLCNQHTPDVNSLPQFCLVKAWPVLCFLVLPVVYNLLSLLLLLLD